MHQRPDTGTDETEERGRRLDLSVPQVAGSALAAVAAAVLASRLGVYGTIIGAGVVSVVATCGGSVFQHLFSRTGEQLRGTAQGRPRDGGPAAPEHRAFPAGPGGPNDRADHGPADPGPDGAPGPAAHTGPGGGFGPAAHPGADGGFGAASTHGTRVRGRRRPLIAAAVVFGVAMASITGFELASGSELGGGGGTTVGSVVRGTSDRPAPDEQPARPPEGPREETGPGDGPGERGSGSESPDPGERLPERPSTTAPTGPDAPDASESGRPTVPEPGASTPGGGSPSTPGTPPPGGSPAPDATPSRPGSAPTDGSGGGGAAGRDSAGGASTGP
ncbi:hypothetical protein [Streptomyces sp. NPDC020141]|uniref:hypothetical protein n=1 Tax=Streptomyces sp. NPDC020141 TaxID=3365065 RepID=UPI0037A608BF